MSRFNEGDKVQRIRGKYKAMRVNDIDTVISVSDDYARMSLQNYGKGHDPDNFIVVKSTENPSISIVSLCTAAARNILQSETINAEELSIIVTLERDGAFKEEASDE